MSITSHSPKQISLAELGYPEQMVENIVSKRILFFINMKCVYLDNILTENTRFIISKI